MSPTSSNYSHVHPKVRHLIRASDQDRINLVLSQKWIGYERAKQTIDRIEALLNHPPQHRMPGMLVYGRTNNGKTMIVERILRQHPPNDNPEGDSANIAILNIQMPISPDPRRVYTAILSETFASFNPAKHISVLERHAIHQMRACGVRMLILDEFHNMLQGTDKHQKAFLNLLRYIGNELKIPIVCFGIQKSLPALHHDEQLATRYEPWPLHDWKYDKETARLLNGVESLLPLKERSNLCLLYTSPSPRDLSTSRMPSSA